jgi:hypothetical protein
MVRRLDEAVEAGARMGARLRSKSHCESIARGAVAGVRVRHAEEAMDAIVFDLETSQVEVETLQARVVALERAAEDQRRATRNDRATADDTITRQGQQLDLVEWCEGSLTVKLAMSEAALRVCERRKTHYGLAMLCSALGVARSHAAQRRLATKLATATKQCEAAEARSRVLEDRTTHLHHQSSPGHLAKLHRQSCGVQRECDARRLDALAVDLRCDLAQDDMCVYVCMCVCVCVCVCVFYEVGFFRFF